MIDYMEKLKLAYDKRKDVEKLYKKDISELESILLSRTQQGDIVYFKQEDMK